MRSEEVAETEKDIAPLWVRRLEEARREAKKSRVPDAGQPEEKQPEQQKQEEKQ